MHFNLEFRGPNLKGYISHTELLGYKGQDGVW